MEFEEIKKLLEGLKQSIQYEKDEMIKADSQIINWVINECISALEPVFKDYVLVKKTDLLTKVEKELLTSFYDDYENAEDKEFIKKVKKITEKLKAFTLGDKI